MVDGTASGDRLENAFQAFGMRVARYRRLSDVRSSESFSSSEIVIGELLLADGTGFDLVRLVHALERRTPVVVASCFLTVDSALDLVQVGATYCLTKPCTVRQVLDACGRGEPEDGLWMTLDTASRDYIEDTLESCGSVAKTARVLGVDRRSLRRRLARYRAL